MKLTSLEKLPENFKEFSRPCAKETGIGKCKAEERCPER